MVGPEDSGERRRGKVQVLGWTNRNPTIFVYLACDTVPNPENISNVTGEGDGDRGPVDEGERATSEPEPCEPVPSGPEIPPQEYRTGATEGY